MEAPIIPAADRHPARLGNFHSALLGKIEPGFTATRSAFVIAPASRNVTRLSSHARRAGSGASSRPASGGAIGEGAAKLLASSAGRHDDAILGNGARRRHGRARAADRDLADDWRRAALTR
ncbi:MAG: hypothetical protein KGM15_01610 [Pseudomonadota bacterium]|nr:hypothetical protein [Pseudomonadota bacterium]